MFQFYSCLILAHCVVSLIICEQSILIFFFDFLKTNLKLLFSLLKQSSLFNKLFSCLETFFDFFFHGFVVLLLLVLILMNFIFKFFDFISHLLLLILSLLSFEKSLFSYSGFEYLKLCLKTFDPEYIVKYLLFKNQWIIDFKTFHYLHVLFLSIDSWAKDSFPFINSNDTIAICIYSLDKLLPFSIQK